MKMKRMGMCSTGGGHLFVLEHLWNVEKNGAKKMMVHDGSKGWSFWAIATWFSAASCHVVFFYMMFGLVAGWLWQSSLIKSEYIMEMFDHANRLAPACFYVVLNIMMSMKDPLGQSVPLVHRFFQVQSVPGPWQTSPRAPDGWKHLAPDAAGAKGHRPGHATVIDGDNGWWNKHPKRMNRIRISHKIW